MFTDDESVKFLSEEGPKSKLANAKKLSDVNVADYAAIFYVGGCVLRLEHTVKF